jgi:hypothetical protein
MSKKNQKFRQKFRCQFPLDFFLFYRVFGCFLAMGVQKHHKKSCRKVFTKNSTKNPKPTFSRSFVYHVFGRFSMRGVQKHDKKISEKNKSDPSPFSYSDPPTHHGGHRFFFAGPLNSAFKREGHARPAVSCGTCVLCLCHVYCVCVLCPQGAL